MIKTMLEGHGIKTHLANDVSAQFTGIGYPVPSGQALSFAWPEIWVEDGDYDAALALVQDMMQGNDLDADARE